MLTIATVKDELESLLCDYLGTWTKEDGSEIPSIYSGRPPDGVKMTAPGVQCIILDTAQMSVSPFLGGASSLGRFTHTIDLELWMNADIDPPRLNTWERLLALNGIADAPVQRIMTHPFFLNYGVPLNPVNTPRTKLNLAHSIIYVNSYAMFN